MPTAQLHDTSLEYTDRGAGVPIVLVHGSLGDLRSWELQVESLAEDHRVIAYSRRYHHPNPCPPQGRYSASLHADDLAELMSELDVQAAHVVGSSYGAYTALFLAMRHPDRVRTQVLSEPPVLPLLIDHPEGHEIRERFLADVWGPAGDLLQDDKIESGGSSLRMFQLIVDQLEHSLPTANTSGSPTRATTYPQNRHRPSTSWSPHSSARIRTDTERRGPGDWCSPYWSRVTSRCARARSEN